MADLDAFVDLPPLQTPWYEEAQSHWGDEAVEHWVGDTNEIHPYRPETLERIATGKVGS